MELNVKQSGIESRSFVTRYYKNRGGRVLKTVDEKYLRNDISCGSSLCSKCSSLALPKLIPNDGKQFEIRSPHAVIIDGDAICRFMDVFDSEYISNIIILQSVWDHVKKKSLAAYKKMNAFVYEEKNARFFVFLNDLHSNTFVTTEKGDNEEEREDACLVRSASYLDEHWKGDMTPLLVFGDEEKADNMKKKYLRTMSLKEYIQGLECADKEKEKMLSHISIYDKSNDDGKLLFEEHLSHEEIGRGLAEGKIKKAQFSVSRENYREGTVLIDGDTQWFVTGKYTNRAVNGDTVGVELLPEHEWCAPQRNLVLRDLEEATLKANDDENDDNLDDEPNVKRRKTGVVPTAKVVGIIRRNWRPYCGVLIPSILKGGRRHLFCPSERLIPRIRIESEQAEILAGQRIVVSIDSWPRDSKYPLGHYVRTLGSLGDREVENEVLLLEHDIPHSPFSQAVLDCLPKSDWSPHLSPPRVDLRHLSICSVDPKGCTDIDDALHARLLPDGNIEVGVHIADVTHFVRPSTAIDDEAAVRGTTVYLADRRIDMLPEMLSSNLCSLKGNEERYAFSVMWTVTEDGKVLSTKFHKSLIKSSAALTYEKAQDMIDDINDDSEVTIGLRRLMRLSKLLTAQRRANGSLILASSEVRFDVDWTSKTPKGVMVKTHLDTHSMVEEFMLLANRAVAEKVLSSYPECALLRRHPIPSEVSYKPLIEVTISISILINKFKHPVFSFFFEFHSCKNLYTGRKKTRKFEKFYNCVFLQIDMFSIALKVRSKISRLEVIKKDFAKKRLRESHTEQGCSKI
ncbi:dis-3 [Pristionchus pacificus]|nr:dis-3 [Pristionchus pacificus]